MKPDLRSARTSASYWYDKAWKKAAAKGCVFCDLKDKYIIAEKDNVVLTVNIFPYIDGHLLIIPRRHFESFEETTPKEWSAIRYLIKLGKKRLEEKMGLKNIWYINRLPAGYLAMKTVAHTHSHLLPFVSELLKWNYQKIKLHPIELAKKLR